MAGLLVEDRLRRYAPLFRGYPRYRTTKKSTANIKEYQQGRMVTLQTKRDIYEEYKSVLTVVYKNLAYSAILGLIGIFSFIQMIFQNSIFFGAIACITLAGATFYYRHGFGKYGNIADWEEQPVVLPPKSLIDEAEKQGVSLTK